METATVTASADIDVEQVRYRAYMLWLEEGQPEGKAEDHWHRARSGAVPVTAEKPEAPKRGRKKSL